MKKVKFKKVVIQNFLSVGEEPVVVEFTEGLHLITGRNCDKPERKNAVGKSTVADAVYFSIFGETLRELKKDLIVNNVTGGKTQVEMFVDVETATKTNSYHIIRTLTPTKVTVYENGVDKTRDSAANTNKYICDILDASQSLFQNCVIMTVNNAVPFMAKNKVEKRKFIEDIFGLEVFSKMISSLRQDYNDIKKEFDIQNVKLEETDNTFTSYQAERDKALTKKIEKREIYLTRKESNTKELDDINQKLSELDNSDVLNDLKIKLVELENNLCKVDLKLNELTETNIVTRANLTLKKDKYKLIGTEQPTCPVCLRSIDEHDKSVFESEKKQLKDELSELATSLKENITKIETAKGIKQKVKTTIDQKTREYNDVLSKMQSKGNLLSRQSQLLQWQTELEEDLELLNKDTTDFDDILQETQQRRDDLTVKVGEITKQMRKLDIVKFIVSEEGVKSYIVNKLLELLNSKLFYYLQKLQSNSVCTFNEYFEEEIVNEKGKVCSYFNFSGAERKSIDLACLFAFSDIRRMQGGVSYNIAMYDELFDSSFDDKGIELITDILKERVDSLQECAIVISHRKESTKAVTGEIIFLEKLNGITRRVDYSDF
jgi:DNA repair exonuclease SbcCD ATPase subunit